MPEKKQGRILSPPPRKIVFLKTGALGDVLMTTPLVRAVRKEYPRARLVYYTGEWSASALAGNKSLDRVEAFPDRIFFEGRSRIGILKLVSRLRKEHADLLFCLDKALAFNMICALTGIPMRVGFDRRGSGTGLTRKVHFGSPKHDIRYNLDLLLELKGMPPGKTDRDYQLVFGRDYAKMDLAISQAARKHVTNLLAPRRKRTGSRAKARTRAFVALVPGGARNPGQSMLEKRWPVRDYVLLTRMLLGAGIDVVLLGGKTDAELSRSFSDFVPDTEDAKGAKNGWRRARFIDLVGKTTIAETAAIFDAAAVTVCNDSGPMHIAATTHTRVIAIFGPTDPIRLAPLDARHQVLRRQSVVTYEDGKIHMDRVRKARIIEITPRKVFSIVKRMLRARQIRAR